MKSHAHDCFELTQMLVEYRHQKALHHQLLKAAECSMLGIDALVLIYHWARTSPGHILEIGAYVGGATIAIAMGVRDSDLAKQIISIERGAKVDHPRLPTKDSFKDLQRNLKRFGFLDQVALINARSFEPHAIDAVRKICGSGQIGLFVFDADANVRRDIDCYGNLFANRCFVVVDDYLGGTDKTAPLRSQVDELVNTGRLEPLGCYGWGTWFGRWLVN